MFDFCIIDMPNGCQVIDRSHTTPYSALTPLQMMEYVEMEVQLYIADRLKREKAKRQQRRLKRVRSPLYRLAYLCRLV